MSARTRRAAPVRTCVGCGRRDRQAVLRRLQLDAGGSLQPVDRPGSGRSAYTHTSPQCIHGLLKSRLLGRSLRHQLDRAARLRVIELLIATAAPAFEHSAEERLADRVRRP